MNPNGILNALYDGEYTELFAAIDGVTVGGGEIDGGFAYSFAQSREINGGAINTAAALKLKKLFDLADKKGAPIVGFFDGSGGDLKDGAALISAYSDIFALSAKLSGVVPRIAVISGAAAGLSAVLAETFDFVITWDKSQYFFTSPTLDKNPSSSDIKGAIKTDTLENAITKAKELLAILPSNNLSAPISEPKLTEIANSFSADKKGAELLGSLYTDFIELYKTDSNSVVGLTSGTIDSGTVALVYVGDSVQSADLAKIEKLVSFADSFSLPIVTVYNSDGFALDSAAICVKWAAQLSLVYNSATTAKINVITGSAYGGAYLATSGADITVALKTAIIAPVAPKTAAVMLYADKVKENSDYDKFADEYAKTTGSAESAQKAGIVDIITDEANIHSAIANALAALDGKRFDAPRRKHINLVY
jgi:acetyl-CoA carboxylase carboxyltransferase component